MKKDTKWKKKKKQNDSSQKKAEEERKRLDKKRLDDKKSGFSGMEHNSSSYNSSSSAPRSTFGNVDPIVESKKESPKPETKSSIGKGLQLGKAKKTTGVSQLLKEENIQDILDSPSPTASKSIPVNKEKIHVEVSEKIALICENDGGLKSMEIKGELMVTTFDPQCSQCQVHVNQGENKDFQFKAHPNMNKTLYSQKQILALKDTTKSYPTGTSSGILKWRWATKDEKYIPLSINVWPSSSGGETTVPVEYEKKCDFDLQDVVIAIPIPGPSPVVGDVVGSYEYDSKKGILFWKIPLIDNDNRTGSLEFTIPQTSNSSLFPVQVTFNSNSTFVALQVVSVTLGGAKDESIEFSGTSSLSVEQYDIE